MIKLHHLSLVTGVTLATLSLTGVMTKIGDQVKPALRDRIQINSWLKPAQAQKELNSPIAQAISKQAEKSSGFYYPGTEKLASDEMRIISCGTGMPTPRPAQAASCWLVELGNGDKFIFDLGSMSSDNIVALGIPYDKLDKIFLSHLHTDHFGDLPVFFVGSWLMNRQVPLHVYGPSGPKPEWGTSYAVENMQKMLTWDLDGRNGRLPPSGRKLVVHEFDYRAENEVVYNKNGVVIRSWPAIHVIDGPVSYSLEWNGLKFVFGGDTYPNNWFIKYAQDADLAIHEAFIAVPDLIEKFNWPVDRSLEVATQIHTAPPAFGRIMSEIKPRMAVAYHFFNDFDTAPNILEGIRSTYDGPLTLANDMLVWNVTAKDIRVREVVFPEAVWPPPAAQKPQSIDHSVVQTESEDIRSGKADVSEQIDAIYKRANKKYGTNLKPRQ